MLIRENAVICLLVALFFLSACLPTIATAQDQNAVLFVRKVTSRDPDTLDNVIHAGDYIRIRGTQAGNPWLFIRNGVVQAASGE